MGVLFIVLSTCKTNWTCYQLLLNYELHSIDVQSVEKWQLETIQA